MSYCLNERRVQPLDHDRYHRINFLYLFNIGQFLRAFSNALIISVDSAPDHNAYGGA